MSDIETKLAATVGQTPFPEPQNDGEDGCKSRHEGVPALLLGTPLGHALIMKPSRTGNAYEDCQGAAELVSQGVPERKALEYMGVSGEQYYYWKMEDLRAQNEELQRALRRYRRRKAKKR